MPTEKIGKHHWYNHFSNGEMKWLRVKYLSDASNECCLVSVDSKLKITVAKSELILCDEEIPDDLVDILSLHEPNVVSVLESRFISGNPFTFAGDVLVKVRSASVTDKVNDDAIRESHLAQTVIQKLVFQKTSQVILISGDENSGKFESSNKLVNFLTHENERVRAALRIVESFGHISSIDIFKLHGCIIGHNRIFYSDLQAFTGFHTLPILVNISTLCNCETDLNFLVLIEFLRGSSKKNLELYGLSNALVPTYLNTRNSSTPRSPFFFRKRVCTEAKIDSSVKQSINNSPISEKRGLKEATHVQLRFKKLTEALECFNIDIDHVSRILSVIVHISQLEFKLGDKGISIMRCNYEKLQPKVSDSAKYDGTAPFNDAQLLDFGIAVPDNMSTERNSDSMEYDDNSSISWSSRMMQIDINHLADVFCCEKTVLGAKRKRDNLVRHIYSALFYQIVQMINDSNSCTDQYIDVIHSPGLRDTGTMQPFEDFMVNCCCDYLDEELSYSRRNHKTTEMDRSSMVRKPWLELGVLKGGRMEIIKFLNGHFQIDLENNIFSVAHAETVIDYSVNSMVNSMMNTGGHLKFLKTDSDDEMVRQMFGLLNFDIPLCQHALELLKLQFQPLHFTDRKSFSFLNCLSVKSSGLMFSDIESVRKQLRELKILPTVQAMQAGHFLHCIPIEVLLEKIRPSLPLVDQANCVISDVLRFYGIPTSGYSLNDNSIYISRKYIGILDEISPTYNKQLYQLRIKKWWRIRLVALAQSRIFIQVFQRARIRSSAVTFIGYHVRRYLLVKRVETQSKAADAIIAAWKNFNACKQDREKFLSTISGIRVLRSVELVRFLATEQESDDTSSNFVCVKPTTYTEGELDDQTALVSWWDLNLW